MLNRVVRSAKRRLWHRRELLIFCCTAERIARLPRAGAMRRNAVEDLAFYQPTDFDQMPPDRFRAVARERIAGGHHLFTTVEQGLLIQYGWLIDRQTRAEDAELGQVFFPPPESAALYDYWTHPSARGRGLHFAALCQRLHDARDRAHAERAYTYIYSDNAASIRGALKVGFTQQGSLVTTRRFFVRSRFAIPATDDFRAGLLS
jgi:GNAT superfamily N-acetyltransferase